MWGYPAGCDTAIVYVPGGTWKRQRNLNSLGWGEGVKMNAVEFGRKVVEFPFLREILPRSKGNLSANLIGGIRIERVDRNLLEISPCAWAHDAGEYGSHEGYRSFWFVAPSEIGEFHSSWHRSIIPHGTRAVEGTTPLGFQMVCLNRDVQFIVEIHAEGWDWEDKTPSVTIYKMHGFDWRHHCRFTKQLVVV